VSWKLSRTVLRGAVSGNAGRLLDKAIGPKKKQAYNIGMADDGVFAFAGLWDKWRDPTGNVIESCTILTTEANALLKPIHTRMPVILKPDDYDRWLDPGVTNPTRVADLLRPFDPRLMRIYPVSTTVNRVENDGPECAKESEEVMTAKQANLFN
jgi:putative SOS response-associated peptidase YedK